MTGDFDWPLNMLGEVLYDMDKLPPTVANPYTSQRLIKVSILPAFDPLNIILLAIAVVVFWRLRSVLGNRTGGERPSADVTIFRPRNERQPPAETGPAQEDRSTSESTPQSVWVGYAEEGSDTALALENIARTSGAFHPESFMEGAKRAYETILVAFAAADKAALKPLLGKEVAASFSAAIDRRQKEGSTLVFQFVGVNSSRFERASLDETLASVTVRFRSDMIHALRNKGGEVIEGDARAVREIEDIWTFERDVTSRDPNWRLVSTDEEPI